MDTKSELNHESADQERECDSTTWNERYNYGPIIEDLLLSMDMGKYIHLFEEANIGLQAFLHLDDVDLCTLGIEDEEDADVLAHKIRVLRNSTNVPSLLSEMKSNISDPDLNPKLSMQQVVRMLCHTGKQLNGLNEMLGTIENHLKGKDGEGFSNEPLDSEYSAAKALLILSTELGNQTELMYSQLDDLADYLKSEYQRRWEDEDVSTFERFQKIIPRAAIFSSIALVLTVSGIYLWKHLRR